MLILDSNTEWQRDNVWNISFIETLYGGQFTLSTQLMKPNFLFPPHPPPPPIIPLMHCTVLFSFSKAVTQEYKWGVVVCLGNINFAKWNNWQQKKICRKSMLQVV